MMHKDPALSELVADRQITPAGYAYALVQLATNWIRERAARVCAEERATELERILAESPLPQFARVEWTTADGRTSVLYVPKHGAVTLIVAAPYRDGYAGLTIGRACRHSDGGWEIEE